MNMGGLSEQMEGILGLGPPHALIPSLMAMDLPEPTNLVMGLKK